MIFVTVGTWRLGYNRLLKAVDELVSHGVIDEEVIGQTGYSSYRPTNMKVTEFCSPAEFRNMISKARMVISHAGMGTIIETLQQRKALVAVPRRRSLGEADNDHQLATAKQLEGEGKILVAYEVSELPVKLEQAKSFVPRTEEEGCQKILHEVQAFVDSVAVRRRVTVENQEKSIMRLWPYKILNRDDDGIKNDLNNIMQHFSARGKTFDMVVFIPNAGGYLSKLFMEMFNNSFEVNFVTVRRASTVAKTNLAKEFVFKRKWLSNVLRHFEVLGRLVKYQLGMKQKMTPEPNIEFDVSGKRILVIDDTVDTGTTLRIVKSVLLGRGAQSVATACISNHLLPEKVKVDYSVYRYKLLRTNNSRDYYAT